ncbi:hypothetical protein B0H66DRAFT_170931 [Apodospora peruviana]|uniref:DNA-directed RNA polymerase subunit n=1 Tax=Apodospora peruviana TaxID=516989 RepID=A0AAE0MCN8_9PEZI|nr:hypothetical protein B0H66DRAFT_170931 [Apodospora peruviana]
MSPSAIESSPEVKVQNSQKSEKKHKREKGEHKKKRAREEDESAAVETTPRKSKKPKSERLAYDSPEDGSDRDVGAPVDSVKKKKSKKERRKSQVEEVAPEPVTDDVSRHDRKKSKKHRKHHEQEEENGADTDIVPESPVKKHKEKKSKKEKRVKQQAADEDMMDVDTTVIEDADVQSDAEVKDKKKRKKEKSKDKKKRALSPEPSDRGAAAGTTEDADLMEVDTPAASTQTLAKIPSDPSFPFYTQTTSIYVPFFPIGFDRPLTNVAAQHLDPLLNHYSPTLRGVLLSYSNLNLSEKPTKASLTNPPTDKTPALLHSVDEYAVGFGWLTFDAHLFIPSRGKWMEGLLQLQSEGHIGVVCWNKFNASIEAKRLPKGWKWVDLAKKASIGSNSLPSPSWEDEAEQAKSVSESTDALDGEELEVVEQIHTTGYWINEQGRKVTGKLRFRIKNFDVGLAGDYGYLSLEGTFLDDDAERVLMAEEREMEKRRRSKQNMSGLLRPMSRRVPEFSMTKFGKEEEEEDSGKRTVLYKGSRPGTPDD